MARFGLCGPSYASQSPTADAEELFNWYVEQIESGGKSQLVLYPTPGLKSFCALPDSPARGHITFTTSGGKQRTFAVSGATFFEVFEDGTYKSYGTVAVDQYPATFAYNQGNQLAVTTGGTLYIFDFAANSLNPVSGMLGSISQVVFCDGYFVALIAGTNQFQISTLLDGTDWPASQVVEVSVFADALKGMVSDHRELWLWSATRGVGYYNSGSSSVFDPIGSASFTEDGLGAGNSIIKADNTVFWINANERGGGVAKRLNGNLPVRISNHAVEYRWSLYPKISDAIGYSYEDQGHTFLVWYFPSGNATWVYDVATGAWHRRGYWDTNSGQYIAHKSAFHSLAWGKHIVGDPTSGNLYEMSLGVYDDAGNVLRRMRISPPISQENEWTYHYRLQVDAEAGIALQAGQGSQPLLSMSYSDDGGHTFSDERVATPGAVGKYLQRMYWTRLGRSRQRCYKIVASDPVPWRIIEGDLTASGFGPSERITKQYQKVT